LPANKREKARKWIRNFSAVLPILRANHFISGYNFGVMIKLASKRVANRRVYKTGVNEMGLVYAEIDIISVDDIVLHRRGIIDESEIKK
jgi:hypothetical protein